LTLTSYSVQSNVFAGVDIILAIAAIDYFYLLLALSRVNVKLKLEPGVFIFLLKRVTCNFTGFLKLICAI